MELLRAKGFQLFGGSMEMIDTQLLKTFVVIAESGSFTRAASYLNLTQSATSHQIRKLEEELGRKLFERKNRKIQLTPAGRRLLLYARNILTLHEEALGSLRYGVSQQVIRVGLPDLYAVYYLPRVLPRFHQDYPEVQPDIFCDTSLNVMDRMLSGELDISVTIRHETEPIGESLGREKLAWMAAPDFDGGRDPVPLVTFPDSCIYRKFALQALAQTGRRWRITFTSQNTASLNQAVAMGLGVTVRIPRTSPDAWRILSEADGFPPLQEAELELARAPTSDGKAVSRFYEILRSEILGDLNPSKAKPSGGKTPPATKPGATATDSPAARASGSPSPARPPEAP